MTEDALQALAREAGLLVDWEDAAGSAQRVGPDSLRAILSAMGLPCANTPEAAESLAELRLARRADAGGLLTANAGLGLKLPFEPRDRRVRLRLEGGTERDMRLKDASDGLRLPPIAEPGYHTLEVDGREVRIAVAPRRAVGVETLAPGRPIWGVAAQVYALRGARPSGFGDFGALAEFSSAAARAGADAVAISPVHALFAADPSRYSPYAPSTRLFLNGLYADPTAVFSEIDTGGEADGGELIDWTTAAPARLKALRRVHAQARQRPDDPRWRAFESFRQSGGADLEGHARFEALYAHFFAETSARGWQGWPEAFRDPAGAAVAAWARDHAEAVEFHAFLQWLADAGLAQAQASAKDAGMAVGLISDLAVGLDAGGSHAWSRPDDLLRGLSVGAPPDMFQPTGQDWGISAFSPQALRRSGYAGFLATLRAAMRHAGGVRIDHAMGLRRLWLTPAGAKPSEGAYLLYPFQDMLRLIALESRRAQALVIGEDLGTVPPGFREALDATGVMGMRVLLFERAKDGTFVSPSRWSAQAAALTTTHDLPTLAGWWRGRDIDWAEELGRTADATADRAARDLDRTRLWAAALTAGVAEGAQPAPEEPERAVDAALAFVGSAPSRLAIAPIEDLMAQVEQPNLPGTIDEHPNWRRRLSTAEPFADRATAARAAHFAAARAGSFNAGARTVPRATYRLQFHKGFPFARGAELAPYLAKLGISHVYSSPIATARAGSNHGYDVVDPTVINPELGGEDGFRAMVAALHAHGLGLILDIVPNHMAVGQGDNAWWLDVLKRGRASRYADFFDIDWDMPDPELNGRIAAPFLGQPYAEALEAGAIRLREVDGQLCAVAHDTHLFPIRSEDRKEIALEGLGLFDPHDVEGRARLHELLGRQHFRLAWWRTANDEINWRRFFDVTELAGLRVEREDVFDAVHALPLRLYAEGLVDGLRVDHVDGLTDPAAYCRRLRARLSSLEAGRSPTAQPGAAWLVVEKILAQGEMLPVDWETDGTTGYDFMNDVAAVLHDPEGEEALTRHWVELSGRPGDFAPEERAARLEMLERSFGAQLEATVRAFHRLARSESAAHDYSAGAIRRSLVQLLAAFPAYRTYASEGPAPGSDVAMVVEALAQARIHGAPGDAEVLEQVALWLCGRGPGAPSLRREALRRFQQLSAPVSAKAVEDTAFYRYSRLISRNDVGSDPARFAADIGQFHAANQARAQAHPHAMLATATHDHKRGEDVRARLAALGGLAGPWIEAAGRWSRANADLGLAIDPADEYELYQTLVGAWPTGLASDDEAGLGQFADRLAQWRRKALREAKLRSSWARPDEAYEEVCEAFLRAALDPRRSVGFLADCHGFTGRLTRAALPNSLVQAVLRCTVPGVPDLYQGAELWDLSLVDPDNRRPVDFKLRQHLLDRRADDLADTRDGAIKLHVVRKALAARSKFAAVFRDGGYEPLDIAGSRKDHVLAFSRRAASGRVVVICQIRCDRLLFDGGVRTLGPDFWRDTRIELGTSASAAPAVDLLTDRELPAGALGMSDILASLPVAMLHVPA
ncbi:malto-oligosyltrehalose synthase [Caulobacter sp. S45]|uniref:malto-oligosyltrehalose synthase n=1 Tax=Caulobacter sp. S45 TaxID=1641861 RepID=UPI00157569ED|nr:malto-oligosyltrehalose synthase [Caulobacter sp. S45]